MLFHEMIGLTRIVYLHMQNIFSEVCCKYSSCCLICIHQKLILCNHIVLYTYVIINKESQMFYFISILLGKKKLFTAQICNVITFLHQTNIFNCKNKISSPLLDSLSRFLYSL